MVIDFLVDVKDILIGIVWGVKGYFVRMVKGMKKALEKWEKMDEMKYRYAYPLPTPHNHLSNTH